MKSPMKRAVFLDRDGVITQDPPAYAHRIDQLEIIPKSDEAIRLLNEQNYTVLVVTNQSGIARGYYQEKDAHVFNDEMKKRLSEKKAHVDGIYYCPHHPRGKIEQYRKTCTCRKPASGMLLQGAKDFNVDLTQSFIVGDKWRDIQAGKNVGCTTILVRTGTGNDQPLDQDPGVDYIVNDLYEAVTTIILKSSPRG